MNMKLVSLAESEFIFSFKSVVFKSKATFCEALAPVKTKIKNEIFITTRISRKSCKFAYEKSA